MLFTTERLLLLFVFALLFASLMASAAEPVRPASAHRQYLEERAYCLSGRSAQDRATCLREAGAARNEATSGKLADASADFEKNRIARCSYQKGNDYGYCVRRMRGEGTVSGSVEGGGILRELVVTLPAAGDSPGSSPN
jgi:hypothetical protein